MGKKIMLVDDAAFMRMMIRNMLTQGGYTEIVEAQNGAEAVDMYKSEKPDLVIMDITMPEKDGIEALREIKQHDASSNVVMCSALGQEKLVLDALKLGAADFIVKPFKPDRIMDTVSKFFK